jgi:hypothetical protein
MLHIDKHQKRVSERATNTLMTQLKSKLSNQDYAVWSIIEDLIFPIINQVFSIGYHYGKQAHIEESKAKQKLGITIYQFKDDELVDEFKSISEASRVTGIGRTQIQEALRNKKLLKGYTFEK